MFGNLLRFTLVAVISSVSVMLILGIAGVFSSSEIWSNATKVVQIAAVVLLGSGAVLLVTKK